MTISSFGYAADSNHDCRRRDCRDTGLATCDFQAELFEILEANSDARHHSN